MKNPASSQKILDVTATAENLKRLCREKGTSPQTIREALNLESVQSVYHWMSGVSTPSLDNLVILSDLWKVSIDDIIRTKSINI